MYHSSLLRSFAALFLLATSCSSKPITTPNEGVTLTDISSDATASTPGNVTSTQPLTIDPAFRAETGSNNNHMLQDRASQFMIYTAADIAISDMERRMRSEEFFNQEYDPSMTITVQPTSQRVQLKAKHVVWGIGALLEALNNRVDGRNIPEGGAELYLDQEYIGIIVLHRKPRAEVASNILATGLTTEDGKAITAPLRSNDTITVTLPSLNVTATSSTTSPASTTSAGALAAQSSSASRPSGGDDDDSNSSTTLSVDNLSIRIYYPSNTPIAPADFFITKMKAIIGLADLTALVPRDEFYVEAEAEHLRFSLTPPNPPRSRRPFNNKVDSIRAVARLVNVVVQEDRRYTEVGCGIYQGNVQTGDMTVKRWNGGGGNPAASRV